MLYNFTTQFITKSKENHMLSTFSNHTKKIVKSIWKKYHPKSFLSLYLKDKLGWDDEIDLIPWLCDKESISIDIGCHYGMYLPHLSPYSKIVHVFEANPDLLSFISCAYDVKNVNDHSVALSNEKGSSILRIPENLMGLATIEPENKLNSCEVPT